MTPWTIGQAVFARFDSPSLKEKKGRGEGKGGVGEGMVTLVRRFPSFQREEEKKGKGGGEGGKGIDRSRVSPGAGRCLLSGPSGGEKKGKRGKRKRGGRRGGR